MTSLPRTLKRLLAPVGGRSRVLGRLTLLTSRMWTSIPLLTASFQGAADATTSPRPLPTVEGADPVMVPGQPEEKVEDFQWGLGIFALTNFNLLSFLFTISN